MNKDRLFQNLRQKDADTLLDLLSSAYEFLSYDDREYLFGDYVQELPPADVEGAALLGQIELFVENSQAGFYYAPFDINSKNYRHIPEETEEWFEKMGDYLLDCCRLTEQGDYENAVACFDLLFELIEEIDKGEEIVFADELGSWMIPVDEKQYNEAYLTALAATAAPEAFAERVAPLAQKDSRYNFYGQVYETAVRLANDAQKAQLDAEVKRRKIRTKPER